MHSLTDVDRAALRATCAECGPTTIVMKNHGRARPNARCAGAVRAQRGPSGGNRNGSRGPHGLTRSEARAYVEGKSCAICGVSDRPLVVDHDHETGRVRGALCTPCNVALHYVERPGWVDAARAYLASCRP